MEIAGFLKAQWQEGYYFAGLDSISGNDYYFHRGQKLKAGETIYRRLATAKKHLTNLWNSGYPFAFVQWIPEITLDSASFDFEIINGPLVVYDSIILLSPVKTKRLYLSRVLDAENGEPYSEQNFKSLARKLSRIGFVKTNRPIDVSFQSGKAWTYLDLTESSTGSFSGILGMLPNQGNNGRPIITGNIDLTLHNLFHSGKHLDLSWASFGEMSQKLNLLYEHPFVAGSDVNVKGSLDFLRQDSSFLNYSTKIGFDWYASTNLKLGVQYSLSRADVLLTDSTRIANLGIQSFEQNWYGLYLSNGRRESAERDKYFKYDTELELGNRVDDQETPDGATSKDAINWRIKSNVVSQSLIGKRAAIYLKSSLGWIDNGQSFTNQRFRLGGLKTLRGFNEQEFFPSAFFVQQTEWRLFFEESSYLYALTDVAFLNQDSWSTPIGIGLGITLASDAGLFSFAMAVGASDKVPLNISNTKIHFGYLTRF